MFQSSAASSCGDDAVTVDAVLQKLGLADYVDRFHAEQIDLDSLVCVPCCVSSVFIVVPSYSSPVGMLSLLCLCLFVCLLISQRRKNIAE